MKHEDPFLTKAAGAVAAVTIVLYQAWFIPFFQPFFGGREPFARIVFYAIYGSLALVSTAVFVVRPAIRRRILPFAAVAIVSLAATALHPIGLVTRAYIIAVIIGGATMVLVMTAASNALLQLTAAVTALNALMCFVDLLFSDGFTGTAGRAAGLAINPNVAAAAIVLGATASYRAVPRRIQLSFLVLTAGAIAVTLSRSTMLVAAASVLIPGAVGVWRRARTGQPLWMKLDGAAPAVLVTIGLAIWIGFATVTNDRFGLAIQSAFHDSVSFTDALKTAEHSVDAAAEAAPPAAAGQPSPASTEAPTAKPSDASRIAALDTRLSDEGHRNSMSARTLFLDRALLVYRNNGFFGMGLEAAQALVPHNTFVLFALAYGHLGWLIPIALVALSLYTVRDARDLPLPVAAIGTMATSHDILLTPSLFLPIAIGIGGMLARAPISGEDGRVRRSVAVASMTSVGLFAAGCVLILLSSPSHTVERLSPAVITGFKGAYLVSVPTQTFPGVLVPAVGAGAEEAALFLRDNAQTLTRVPWRPGANPAVGRGQYSITDGLVVFAPADACDPRVSGHVVELGLPRRVGVPFYALLAALAAWCVGLILPIGRSRRAGPLAAGAQGALR